MIRAILTAAFAAVLGCLVLSGCTAPPPAPGPERVEPSWGFNGEESRIHVVGTRFYPALGMRASNDGGYAADGGFSIRLRPAGQPEANATALPGVTHLDLNTLAAVVPPGLLPGPYDVEVRGPAGQLGVGEALFTVRDTSIDAIELSVETVFYEVRNEAAVGVQVVDTQEQPVQDDLAVEFLLEGADGAEVSGDLRVAGIEDPTSEGHRVTGRLGDDGHAVVTASLDVLGEAWVRVRAIEPDSRVREGEVRLAWEPGDALGIEVTLPSWPAEGTRAGDSRLARLRLIDANGNTVTGRVVPVVVTDLCRSWGAAVDLTGEQEVTVHPRAATFPDLEDWSCKENRIVATAFAFEGRSAPFQVLPGPVARFRTTVIASTPQAGDAVTVVVQPVDLWSNPATWSGGIVAVDDGAGGAASFACEAGTTYACDVVVTRAGPVELTLADAGGITGRTTAFDVSPGAPTVLRATPDTLQWVAGQPVGLVLGAEDAYGNPLPASGLVDTTVVPSDPLGESTCAPGPPSDARIACTLFSAKPEVELGLVASYVVNQVPVPVTGRVDVEVVNGPIHEVRLVPATRTVHAGQPLPVDVRAFDAWNNPWVVKDDGAVRLADTVGSLEPVEVQIGATGAAKPFVTLTRAGFTELVALGPEVELGRSEAVLVEPAAAERIAVEITEPWAWVGEPTPIRLEALDAFGNRADLSGTVRLRSLDDAAPEVETALQNGVGEATLRWDRDVDGDVVDVAALAPPFVGGSSAPITVVIPCDPVDSPAVDVAFGGSPFARACLDEGLGSAQVQADVVGVPAQGRTIRLHGVAVGEQVVVQQAPQVRVRMEATGVYDTRVLVVQDDGCAAEVATRAWIGLDDGQAVGPLDVRAVGAGLSLVESPSSGIASVLGATTCDGAPAVGAALRVRADRGRVTGAAPTGAGLQVIADATGSASAGLDVSQVADGGPAVVSVVAPSGLAWGRATFDVHGDLRAPVVQDLTPEGTLQAPTSSARVTFSEPIDPTTVSGAVQVLPEPPGEWSVSVEPGGRALALAFDVPLPPTPAGWQITVAPAVTDLAGNPLAGTWEETPAAWTGSFGGIGTVEPVSTCDVDLPVFRPDGDDGSGPESDDVRLSFASSELPVWWSLRVTTPDGELVRFLQLAPSSRDDSWRWDGRDQHGRVVAPGPYRLTVDTKGSKGGTGGACSREVRVDLVEVAP